MPQVALAAAPPDTTQTESDAPAPPAEASPVQSPPASSSVIFASPDPFPPKPVSLGQPPRIRTAWGALAGFTFDQEQTSGRIFANASKRVLGPRLGGFEITLEGVVGAVGGDGGAAAGVYFGLPWFAVGNEYAGQQLGGNTFAFSFRFPERRGGMLGWSDLLRVDYHPGRREILGGLSLQMPFNACRPSRPRRTGIVLAPGTRPVTKAPRSDVPLDPETERHLEEVRHAVEWMDRLLTPTVDDKWLESEAASYRDHIRLGGHTFREEDSRYHRGLDEAFSSILGGDARLGAGVAALAESTLFREVVVPFDRALGQEKSPRHAGGFCSIALQRFEARLPDLLAGQARTDSTVARDLARCREAFRVVLVAIQEASSRAGKRWENPFLLWTNRSAMGWIPLQYGLRPEQYDTQAEWDAVIASVAGEPFTSANSVRYLMMEQFHPQLKRMIRETREYQVTIVHDFRGLTPARTADLYGWDLVVDGYLPAFVQAIHEIDAGERDRLPQFFLFLDANYYEANRSRGIVSYMEHLYDPPNPRLKPPEIGTQVDAAHEALRAAIRGSRTFRDADEERLREAFQVHVSITNPFDPAFMLDVTRRDHRKLAFHDVTELDPSIGSAVVTGQGIGEHYNGTGWEDRSLLLRGSSLVRLKTATRQLLFQQGFREREIPEALRAQPFPADYEERCARLREIGWVTPAGIFVNETGYGAKEATVLKAAVFSLAPPGSVLLSYDSLWISDFWAGMFLSAALRGARTYPVGPTPLNAPSAAPTTLSFLRQNLHRMFRCRQFFAEDFARSGGELRVGLYDHDVQTQDFRRRADAFLKGRVRHAFLRELITLDPGVEQFMTQFRDQFEAVSQVGLKVRPRPFLHMKSFLFASEEAFRIYRRPEWAPTLKTHMGIRLRQVQGMGNEGIGRELFTSGNPGAPGQRSVVEAFRAELDSLDPSADRRVMFTFATGSHNQNPRSMLLDGEILVAMSGYDCVITLIDLGFILCISEWPENEAEFERLFPRENPPFYLTPFLKGMEDQS